MERDTKRTSRPVLIVGGSGQIGERLRRVFSAHGQAVVPTSYRSTQPGAVTMDATDRVQVMEVVTHVDPWLIVNSMNARGGTDACEADPGLAQGAHFESARHLIDAARGVGARFVQISTDYVFDGRAGPYREDAIPAPLSQLGRAKLQAEQYALAQLPDALVLRTSFVFSWAPHAASKNFVMQLFEHDQTGSMIRVPIDQVGNVTYAPNFAQALVELVELGARGVYHVAGTTRCSKAEWALRVADYFHLHRALIRGVSTQELAQPGPRPLASGFCLDKVQAVLKRTRLLSLDEGLAEMAREMELSPTPVGAR